MVNWTLFNLETGFRADVQTKPLWLSNVSKDDMWELQRRNHYGNSKNQIWKNPNRENHNFSRYRSTGSLGNFPLPLWSAGFPAILSIILHIRATRIGKHSASIMTKKIKIGRWHIICQSPFFALKYSIFIILWFLTNTVNSIFLSYLPAYSSVSSPGRLHRTKTSLL